LIYSHIKKLRNFGLIRTKIVRGKHHFYTKGDHLLFHGHRHLDNEELRERYQEIKRLQFRMNGYRVREKNQWEIAAQNRAILLNYVTKNPGLHFREIGRHLNLSIRQMRSAISSLENEKEIFSEYVGRYKLLFPMSIKGEWKPIFLNPKTREIAEIIKNNPGITSQDIAKKRELKRSTILYHTGKLIEAEIIKVKVRKGRHYYYWTGKEYLETHENPPLNGERVKECEGRGRPYEKKNHPSRIIKFIMENPGAHFSEIKRCLGISTGSLSNTIKKLESNKEIVSRNIGGWKRVYPSTMKEIPISPLTPPAKKVYDSIDKELGSSCQDLAEKLGFTRQNIRYHTQNLEKRDYIRTGRDGRKLIFFIN